MSEKPLSSSEYQNGIEIIPVAGRIGAEVRGIKLSGSLAADAVETIQETLVKYKVIFFRGQNHLDDQEQEAFAELLGEPARHPTLAAVGGTKYMLELDGDSGRRAASWHTDVTFIDAYPKASVLRSIILPESGGDTVWANTASAYENLPAHLRAFADTLWAIHTNDYDYIPPTEGIRDKQSSFLSTIYEAEHPVVRVHPISGERTLQLGHFVKYLRGYSLEDSRKLVSLLQGHVTALENTVRWCWSLGDVAIWDNRATQHYALNDYGTQRRLMRRVTLKGEVPVAVDGSLSRSIRKG
ncbi:TauD/TfdA family dioxygenase [Pseudomonas sp. S60]|uniref:TauD/TfdA dioxygenase family protein n=1 Tax=unclassified Pseudomonas TaxID=196821 RepID=UPI001912D94E|nr:MULTISPECIES: TauD/TfdA family dioxygenase [unclassified Pseudomonas]MBK5006917.1 TauD/TfdA family dioxygenase [Pseudomonas sp. S32]MBK5012418.1 TauD/TfdA family dioxygenase [Pseudomonas sp. S60]